MGHFKVFIEFTTLLLLFYLFLAVPCSLQGLLWSVCGLEKNFQTWGGMRGEQHLLERDMLLEQWVGSRESQPILLPFEGLVFWLWCKWDVSSPTRDWTCTPCIGRQGLKHWTTILKYTNWIKLKTLICTISQPSFTSGLAGATQDLDILSNIK